MKRCLGLVLIILLLAGCGAQETFETVTDAYVQPAAATAQPVHIALPESAAVPAIQNEEAGTLYLCDGYTVTVRTVQAGDLSKTLRDATGFTADGLTLMETQNGEYKRYDCVWTAAGEGEDQVGRLALIDDGSCHYVLTTMAGASQIQALETQWQRLFDSFSVGEMVQVSTGS